MLPNPHRQSNIGIKGRVAESRRSRWLQCASIQRRQPRGPKSQRLGRCSLCCAWKLGESNSALAYYHVVRGVDCEKPDPEVA